MWSCLHLSGEILQFSQFVSSYSFMRRLHGLRYFCERRHFNFPSFLPCKKHTSGILHRWQRRHSCSLANDWSAPHMNVSEKKAEAACSSFRKTGYTRAVPEFIRECQDSRWGIASVVLVNWEKTPGIGCNQRGVQANTFMSAAAPSGTEGQRGGWPAPGCRGRRNRMPARKVKGSAALTAQWLSTPCRS